MTLEAELAVEPGDPVSFALTVTNADDEPHEVTFRSGLEADFVVSREGEVCWRWSDGRAFVQALSTETFAPGESVTYTATWEPEEPGTYAAVGALNTVEDGVSDRAEFDV